MRFEFEAGKYVLNSWADLLSHPFGRWEDLQIFDTNGLLAFAVQHERMVAVRVEAPRIRAVGVFEESGEEGEPLPPEQVSFLLGVRADAQAR